MTSGSSLLRVDAVSSMAAVVLSLSDSNPRFQVVTRSISAGHGLTPRSRARHAPNPPDTRATRHAALSSFAFPNAGGAPIYSVIAYTEQERGGVAPCGNEIKALDFDSGRKIPTRHEQTDALPGLFARAILACPGQFQFFATLAFFQIVMPVQDGAAIVNRDFQRNRAVG